jgi:hypothetical protein
VREHFFGKALGLDAQLARAAPDEMPREQRDVVAPFAQRRHAHADHIQAMVQIVAKRAVAHALVQVLVRCRDHAHIGAQLLVPADTIERAVRQYAQQPRLQFGRHVTDFIQEKRAAFGLLESAAPQLLRASERAAFMAEKLGFEKVLGHRSRVDCDEGSGGARTMTVQRPRNEFLSGSGFTGNQHRRARLRKAPHGTEDLLHRLRLAENFGTSPADSCAVSPCSLSSSARRIRSTAWSTSKGFGRYSYAPPWNAETAESRSE